MVVKPFVCGNDERAKDDNEVEEFAWVLGELKSLGTKELWLVFTNVMKKLFPSKSLAKNATSHFEDSIEGKLVTPVVELKVPDCFNATE